MLPYFEIPSLPLGPLSIEPFGVLVALGIAAGARIASREAARDGLDPKTLADYALWGVVGGLLGGHFVHLFAYHPEELAGDPWKIVRLWDGLSSFGGLLGALVAAALFFRRRGVPFSAHADALALGVAPGWAVARLGCFAAHDHPGVLTDFPLAVAFPGGARHDLGLYDALVLFALAALLHVLRSRDLLRGRLLPLLALTYGASRFALDFLRATDLAYVDARYFGLTPAQYGSIALVLYGISRLLRGSTPVAFRPTGPSAPAH